MDVEEPEQMVVALPGVGVGNGFTVTEAESFALVQPPTVTET